MASKQTPAKKKQIKRKIGSVKRKTAKRTGEVKDKAKTLAVGEPRSNETPDRVTTQTIEEHRKEVLHGSRRFIYPLTHSKHKVAIISSGLFLLLVISIFAFTALMLYRYQRTDDFAYRVSQIVPYPVARVDGAFVSYEDYLFEVRQNMHFYTTQENINFEDEEGVAILANIKSEALQRIKENAMALRLAEANGVTVTDQEVLDQIATIREQGGIGDSDEALENTLQDFYNWTLEDFYEVIELQLIKQKLISILDVEARATIESLQGRAAGGEDFAELAEANSQDPFSKDRGGNLGAINRANTDFPPVFVEAAFELSEGEVSEVVQSSVGLHVIKHLGVDPRNEEQIRIAHILVQFKDINQLLREEIEKVSVTDYITIDGPDTPDGVIESRPQTDDLR